MKCESLLPPRMETSSSKEREEIKEAEETFSQSESLNLPLKPAKSFSGRFSSSPASSLSFLSSASEDSGSSSSSDFSSASGESSDIPVDLVADAVAPRLHMETVTAGDLDPQGRERCVGRHDRVTWGSSSVIGRRREMEDALAVVPGFMSRACSHVGGCTAPGSGSSDQISPVHFFGVYDGHGGSEVAKFCAERMHAVIEEEWGKEETNKEYEWHSKWEVVLSTAFERLDEEVFRENIANDMVGTTAVVAVVSGCQIILSNCGDSRAILCRGTQTIPLTVDQKPDREDELMRIEGGGGKVINWNGARVLGVLAMSRALGDRYMRPFVIPVPEVSFTTRTLEDECLILASDGVWEVMSNNEVGMLARRLLRKGRRNMVAGGPSPAQFTADKLREMAIAKSSSDNISIIVVDLKSRRRHHHQQPRETDDNR